jgi:hypothetical protein
MVGRLALDEREPDVFVTAQTSAAGRVFGGSSSARPCAPPSSPSAGTSRPTRFTCPSPSPGAVSLVEFVREGRVEAEQRRQARSGDGNAPAEADGGQLASSREVVDSRASEASQLDALGHDVETNATGTGRFAIAGCARHLALAQGQSGSYRDQVFGAALSVRRRLTGSGRRAIWTVRNSFQDERGLDTSSHGGVISAPGEAAR